MPQIGDIVPTDDIPNFTVYAVNLIACANDNILRARLIRLDVTPAELADVEFHAWVQAQFQVFADAEGVPVSSVVVAVKSG